MLLKNIRRREGIPDPPFMSDQVEECYEQSSTPFVPMKSTGFTALRLTRE